MDTLDMLARVARAKPKQNRMLFFGRDDFSDNSKYLFLHYLLNNPGAEPVWCTRNSDLAGTLSDQGFPVFDMAAAGEAGTISFLIEAATAVFCTNALNSLGSFEYLHALAGARKIQLWHGVGIKKIDMMMTPYTNLRDKGFLSQLMGVLGMDYVLSPSAFQDEVWRQAFGTRPGQIIRAGLPRNELLFRPARSIELINSVDGEEFFAERKSPRVLFCPTFSRMNKPLWQDEAIIGQMLKFTLERGGHVVIKPHPFEAKLVPPEGLFDEAFTVLPAGTDIYPLLSQMDMLVTDFSSLFVDFLLTGKPVVTLDTEEMRASSHLLHEPDRYLPAGPVLSGTDSIYSALCGLADDDGYQDARQAAANLAFETSPAVACTEIAYFIDNLPPIE